MLGVIAAIFAAAHSLILPNVLLVQGGKLIALPTLVKPCSAPTLKWEGGGSSWSMTTSADGSIDVSLRLDVLGPRSPYWLLVRLRQEASGYIDVECEVDGGNACYAEHFSAASYADLASIVTVSHDTIAALLARAADGHEPADIDALTARLSSERRPVSSETREAIARLDSEDWREREAVAATLSRLETLPELREAEATEPLSAEQRRAVLVILEPMKVGNAVLAAIKP